MAPSSGHQLLPKVWRVARFAYEKAARTVKARLTAPVEPASLHVQPAYARIVTRQPVNKIGVIRQSQSRFFSTSRASTRLGAQAVKGSQIRAAVSRLTTQTPFSTALRPNLTGGTLGRTAGGYTIGAGRIGGARYFSSSPAAPAQVVQNVSAGVRAFWLSGQRTRFDGIDKKTGRKQYRVVTTLQDEAGRKIHAVPYTAPGSYIDFELSPTITALGCLPAMKKSGAAEFEPVTLNTDNLMELLSIDLARALKDFAAVMNDLKKLSSLGDLPLSLHDKSTLRIRFPGCDAESVERLCDEVGVERGVIHQDKDFELRNGTEMALLFPFAPSHSGTEEELFSIQDPVRMSPNDQFDWRHMISSQETMGLTESPGQEYHYVGSVDQNPWASPRSGYSSMGISELGDRAFFPDLADEPVVNSASDYEGFQGIYKFIEECDRAKR